MIEAFVRALEPHQLAALIDAAQTELRRRSPDDRFRSIEQDHGLPEGAVLGYCRTAEAVAARREAARQLRDQGLGTVAIARALRRDPASIRNLLRDQE